MDVSGDSPPPLGERPRRRALLAASIVASLAISVAVYRGAVSPVWAIAWLLTPALYLMACRPARRERPRPSSRSAALPLLFAALLPVAVRVACFDGGRLHQDELVLGSISATHDFRGTSFFALMPERGQFVAQFPTPYFLIERIFLSLFGPHLLVLRLSNQLFVALASLALFLIARETLDAPTALAAVVLYAFFGVSLYLETLASTYLSGTAAFAIFFYFALRHFQTRDRADAARAGVACGFCYLVYYSSYIALPILFAFFAVRWMRDRSVARLGDLAVALGAFLVVVGPFVAESLRTGHSTVDRANDIALLTGHYSPHWADVAAGADPWPIIGKSAGDALRAMGRDGVGGSDGYDFGHLALFDRFALWLFLLGAGASLLLMFKRPGLFFALLAIAIAFWAGVVMTIPPPAYHRFSVAFPFLVLVMAVPFFLLRRTPGLSPAIANALTVGLLLVFAARGLRQHAEAVFRDPEADDLRLAAFLDQRYPDRPLRVAASRFAFERIYSFVGTNRSQRPRVISAEPTDLLRTFDAREKYVYALVHPFPLEDQFRQADPRGKLLRFSRRYSLFAN